jgi:hypothetical protein
MNSVSGIAMLIGGWLVGAAHLQLYLTGQGIFVGSTISSDRWNRICHYYKPGEVVKLRIPVNGTCEIRLMPPGAKSAASAVKR